jgi:Ca-activated chloride channel family protein
MKWTQPDRTRQKAFPTPIPGCARLLVALLLLSTLAMTAAADGPWQLVARGNTAYEAGNYDEALQLYDEASVEVPESPRVDFNRGTALYRKGDYEAATEAFKEAALKSRFPDLGSRAKYNLGNCAFRLAEHQRGSDLKKAVEHCRTSIQYYQEALELNPEFKQAAENIERVRLYLKTLLDELKQQQEDQNQQQKNQDGVAEKLKELLKRQRTAVGQNQSLAEQKMQSGKTPEWTGSVSRLAEDQASLQDDTADVLNEMDQLQQTRTSQKQNPAQSPARPGAGPQAGLHKRLQAAMRHVGQAINSQGKSIPPINQQELDPAREHQQMAVQNLEEALRKLSQNRQPESRQSQQQKNQQPQEQQQQQEDRQEAGENQPQPQQQQQQQSLSSP